MPTRLLRHKPHHPGPLLELHADIALPLARVHEVCGPARRTFAMWLAGRTRGPVLWISPLWEVNHPNPDGMSAFVDPARFVFVTPRRAEGSTVGLGEFRCRWDRKAAGILHPYLHPLDHLCAA